MSNVDQHINSCRVFAQRINARKNYPRDVKKIKRISLLIGEIFQLNEEKQRLIERAVELMDVGEIIVKENTLNKNSALTHDERKKIEEHPKETVAILKAALPCNSSNDYADLLKAIRHAHERYDGQGYPDGIKHKNSPLESRILSFAVAYVAMTSHIEYRPSLSDKETQRQIKNNVTTQFCPEVALAGLNSIRSFHIEQKAP